MGEKVRKKVILDTDMGNEIDDMYALAYLLGSSDVLDILAITLEPFSGSPLFPGASLGKSQNLNYDITVKILNLCRRTDLVKKIYKGAEQYFKDDENYECPATEPLAKLCRENEEVTILAIGCCSNLAYLFRKHPEIISKVKVVWLGGQTPYYGNNHEFNFSQDIEADRVLFGCGVDLTVIPCWTVAANLIASEYEIEHYLGHTELGKFLVEQLVNFKRTVCSPEKYDGYAKILWDLSVIGFMVDESWYVVREFDVPAINDDETYSFTETERKVKFVLDIRRYPLMNDFFTKTQKLAQ